MSTMFNTQSRISSASNPQTVRKKSSLYSYAFPETALKRWSSEFLTLAPGNDHQLQALFEWQGTTCGHMGEELRFIYDITLSSATNGYRILKKICRPQAGNRSYQAMCAYIKQGSAFLETIADHDALLGRPLAKALEWDPEVMPAGCQCTEAFQDHKWKVVLQTLHYRLHQL